METESLRWLQQVADGTTVTEVSELESVTQSGAVSYTHLTLPTN